LLFFQYLACFNVRSCTYRDICGNHGAGCDERVRPGVRCNVGPVMWVMLNELFGSDIRTTAVAVCTAVNWMTNWLVTHTFPMLAQAGLGVAFGLYTLLAGLALIFVLKVLPETRERSLS
jgi:sugar transport protein